MKPQLKPVLREAEGPLLRSLQSKSKGTTQVSLRVLCVSVAGYFINQPALTDDSIPYHQLTWKIRSRYCHGGVGRSVSSE